MTLAVTLRHRQGETAVALDLASDARIVALFGPSGSGKTTILNIIAGLIRPDTAKIAIDGRVLTDTETGVHVPPHRRRIGYVFQDMRLFPHLDVRKNLVYGRRFAAQEDEVATLDEIVDLLDIGHLMARATQNLSGGEKQRVALGRALLAAPRLLLMDEPLASLDERRKAETLPYLVRLCAELAIPAIYVSHKMEEIAAIGAQVLHVGPAGPSLDAAGREG